MTIHRTPIRHGAPLDLGRLHRAAPMPRKVPLRASAGQQVTRDEAIAASAQALTDACAEMSRQDPRAVAEASWPVVAGLKTVDEAEADYRAALDDALRHRDRDPGA